MTFVDNSAKCIADINARAERAMKRAAMEVEAKYKAGIRDNLNTTGMATGDLMNSTSRDVQGSGMQSRGIVGNVLVYGRIHEFGGVIYPKNGPYLVFQTSDGEWHSVTSVTIPARPTLRPAIMDEPDMLGRIFREEMGR